MQQTAKINQGNNMIELHFNNQQAVLSFPQELLSADYVQDFLDRLKVEAVLEKSQLTEAQASTLAESIQENWWNQTIKPTIEV
jgi:hypothetical protein